MSTVDELFETMSESSGEPNDACFIDPSTRIINVPSMYKELGVVSDEKVNRIYFVCSKIVGDNVDLTKYNLYVNYQNAAGELNAYLIDDVAIMEVTQGNTISFSWLLSRHVTEAPGTVRYIICAKKSDGINTTNEWNTKVATGIVIANDIEPVKEIEEQNADVIEQILSRIDVLENGSGSSVSLGIKGAKIGQSVQIKSVDSNGQPTAWEMYNFDDAVLQCNDHYGVIYGDDLPTQNFSKNNRIGHKSGNVVTIAEVDEDGVVKDFSSKELTVPTKLSEFENDSGYATKDVVPSKIFMDCVESALGIKIDSETATIEGISSIDINNLQDETASVVLKSDNLCQLPYDNNFANEAQNEDATATKNGVTFKPNADGSISVWGTATAVTQYQLRNYYRSASNTSRFKLPAGTYTVGIYSNTGTVGSKIRVVCNKYTATAVYEGHPGTFIVTDDTASTFTTFAIQVTTSFTDVTEDDPVIVYPMLNEGDSLKPFNTPKKRLPVEENSYIPDALYEVSKDGVIENVSFNDSVKSIETSGVKELSISSSLKYKIAVTALVDSSEVNSTLLKDLKILESCSSGFSPKNICVESFNSGDEIVFEESLAKKNKQLVFFGSVSTMGTIKFYHGVNVYNSGRVEISSTNVKVVTYNTTDIVRKDVEHGLTIADYIGVIITVGNNNNIAVTVVTNGGTFTVDDNIWWGSSNGEVKIVSDGAVLSNVSTSWDCSDFKKPIWLYGDSYLDFWSTTRWPHYLIKWGYDNLAAFGYPGAKSENVYPEWLRTLNHGTPKYAVWCLGMNDIDNDASINSDWKTYADQFIQDCKDNQIEPILATIPNTPERRHTFKNEYVRASGCRYIDFAKAVNAETYPSEWYTGMLYTDNTHPAEQGAIALAMRALTDLPEFLQNKI
jgi:hypothetical protein